MQHCGTRILQTPRLILRPFSPGDGEAMFRNWASDPEVTRFMTWPPHENPDQTSQLCMIWAANALSPNKYIWAIEHRECGEVIGSLSVADLNESTGVMELGFCLGRAFWGSGYMTEALSAVLKCLFEHTSVRVIRAAHDTSNPASGRVMDKAGMMREGIGRGTGVNNRGICDVYWHSLTRAEYEERQEGRVREIADPDRKREICRGILSLLPEWFGIPEATEAYIRDSGDQRLLAVFSGDVPTGFVCLRPTSADTLELAVLGVRPECHRQGTGRLLVHAARAFATREGYRLLQVKTLAAGQSAAYDRTRLFYRACGFMELEVIPTLWGRQNPCQIMVLPL